MMCRLCTWAADTFGDADWIEESKIPLIPSPAQMRTVAIEAHAECAQSGGSCTCQHWTPSRNTHILGTPLNSYPPRCGRCYRRIRVTKGGLIWTHKIEGSAFDCPGSSEQPLQKGTAPSVISLSRSSDESPDE